MLILCGHGNIQQGNSCAFGTEYEVYSKLMKDLKQETPESLKNIDNTELKTRQIKLINNNKKKDSVLIHFPINLTHNITDISNIYYDSNSYDSIDLAYYLKDICENYQIKCNIVSTSDDKDCYKTYFDNINNDKGLVVFEPFYLSNNGTTFTKGFSKSVEILRDLILGKL